MRALIVLFMVFLLFFSGCISTDFFGDSEKAEVLCNDSDGGIELKTYGKVIYKEKEYKDNCAGKTLITEYYCQNDTVQSITERCDPGEICSEGVCILDECIEYDIGMDIYKKSNISQALLTYEDYCKDSSTVYEYYCNLVKLEGGEINCPENYRCSDGACVCVCSSTYDSIDLYKRNKVNYEGTLYEDYCHSSLTVIKYTCEGGKVKENTRACPTGTYCYMGVCQSGGCVDYDDGYDIFTASYIEYYGATSGVRYDRCSGDYVLEYACIGSDYTSEKIPCPDDYECSGGRCIELECEDGDGGKDKYEASYVRIGDDEWEDYCRDDDTVREYYCSDGEVKHKDMDCPSDYYCDDGECVKATCYDSDGGKDRYDKGTTRKGSREETDYCYTSNSVKEYYCSNGEIKSEILVCPSNYYCSNGECISVECTDSDGGKDYYEKGYTSSPTQGGFSDYCEGDFTLIEYYCSDSEVKSQTINIVEEQHCEDGEIVSGCPDGWFWSETLNSCIRFYP